MVLLRRYQLVVFEIKILVAAKQLDDPLFSGAVCRLGCVYPIRNAWARLKYTVADIQPIVRVNTGLVVFEDRVGPNGSLDFRDLTVDIERLAARRPDRNDGACRQKCFRQLLLLKREPWWIPPHILVPRAGRAPIKRRIVWKIDALRFQPCACAG